MGLLQTSPSVNAALREFDASAPIRALDLVAALLKRHPEYGRGIAGSIVARLPAPETAATKPAFEWIDEVTSWVDSQQ